MDMANQIIDWIALLAIIATFIISIKSKNSKDLLPIKIYIFLSVIFNLLIKITDILPQTNLIASIAHITLNIFSILEFTLIYYFLYTRIIGARFRKLMIAIFIIYIGFCSIIWITIPGSFISFIPPLFGLEGFLITIPCFFYIYEILKSDLIINLNSDANFIITCGTLFYFCVSIPTYLSWHNLFYLTPGIDKLLLLSNSIFYAILFISFMKAFLCSIQAQKQ
jgi:hypothetical protein